MSNFFHYLILFIAMLINILAEVFVWSKFYKQKICFKNIWLYIALIIMSILGILNYFYVSAFIRVIIVTVLMGIFNYLIFRREFINTIIAAIYTQLLLAISDIIGAVILILIFGRNLEFIKNNIFGSLFGNALISFILFVIGLLPFTRGIYEKILKLAYNFRVNRFIKFCILIIVSINFLMATIYYKMNSLYVVIINLILLLIYSYIVYRTLNEKNNSLLIKAENDSLMESLHQYEDMVDRQRVDNHENKNQLLIIKNMINKNDKDVVKYIDTIVKDQMEDDEALYTRVMTIPSGGLQGIIYQKMLVMRDEHILFSLDVSRDVRKIDLDDFSMEDNYKLCKIVGVLLDNAIEESRNVKDKCIMISLYVDEGKLVVDVSNRFNGEIDIDKLDDEGYTTKGDGHGYGLSLVKKILNESDIFENERSIKKDVFKQVIKVRIKNT